MTAPRLALLLALPLAVACGDKDDDSGAAGTTGTTGTTGATGDGEALYTTYCAGCHGVDGEGVSGPALSDVVPGLSAADIEAVILNGDGSMPAISVTESEASAIASYVLSGWGS